MLIQELASVVDPATGEVLTDRTGVVFVVTLILSILATTFTALRLVSKWGVVKKHTVDDYFTLVAWVFSVALSVSIMIGTRVGLGAPDALIKAEWEEPLKRAVYAFTVFYNPALMTTKTAILVLYVRMSTAHPFLRRASWATMLIVNLAGIVLTFLNIFQCRPVQAAFSGDSSGKCIDVVALYLSSAPINVLTDLAILLLPLPILTGLRMEFRQKVILVATFIVGGFVTIVDVVRIAYLQNALKEELAIDPSLSPSKGVSASNRPANFTYHASFSLMWSAVEVNVGLFCCCVLVLKPLVMRVLPMILTNREPTVLDGSGEPTHSMDLSVKSEPRSPLSPVMALGTIPENRPVAYHDSEDGSHSGQNGDAGESEEDGDLDFFQMLSSAPEPPPVTMAEVGRRESAVTRPRSNSANLLGHFTTRQTSRLSTSSQHSKASPMIDMSAQAPTANFFDFVDMSGKKPLTELSAREAWWPVLFVSSLFFLWGFAYGLLGTLNGAILNQLGYSAARSIALHNSYWIAYLFGPAVFGYWVLTREGFKATFMTGLAIYATGAMAFWPSSVLLSYAGFFISNFIIALGLSCLEVSSNPFIAIAGPSHLAEARLNFAQGIQGVGSILSPIVANYALVRNADVAGHNLFNVQWCYLAVALFVVSLAVVFFYVPLSEASDDDLEALALQRLFNAGLEPNTSVLGMSARRLLLVSGTVVMFLYLGAQESVSYFWGELVVQAKPTADAFWQQAIEHGIFAAGRFIASGLIYFGVPPRYILLGYTAGAFISSLLARVLPLGNGSLGMLQLLGFFESAIFPTLFAMTLRGQGKHLKLASTALTMAISGGAGFPSVSYAVQRNDPNNPRSLLAVVIALFAACLLFPAVLCLPTMRRWVDPKWSRWRPEPRTEGGTEEAGQQSNLASPQTVRWSPQIEQKGFSSHLEVS